jgi:hypothetical protein
MINLGFLTEGKQAAILITPSSWGSQLASYLLHQIGSISNEIELGMKIPTIKSQILQVSQKQKE